MTTIIHKFRIIDNELATILAATLLDADEVSLIFGAPEVVNDPQPDPP